MARRRSSLSPPRRLPTLTRAAGRGINNNLGMLVLALWVLLSGLANFIPQVRPLGPVLPFLAVAAGFLILTGR